MTGTGEVLRESPPEESLDAELKWPFGDVRKVPSRPRGLEVGTSLVIVGPARVPGGLGNGSHERESRMRSESSGATSCKVYEKAFWILFQV